VREQKGSIDTTTSTVATRIRQPICSEGPIPDSALATVGGEDDDGREGGLEGAVEKGEALKVEHVHLVDEEDAGHQLRNALVNVLVDNLVDLRAQLVRDLRLLGLHESAHHADNVLPALRPRVGGVQVVQRDVLDDLLLLVHLALGQRHVLLRLSAWETLAVGGAVPGNDRDMGKC